MHVSEATRSRIVKALRVLLVFTLVFWTTFRVETIAFADPADAPVSGEDQPIDAAGPDGGQEQAEEQGGADSGSADSPSAGDGDSEGASDEGAGAGTQPDAPGGNAGGNADVPKQDGKATTFQNLEVHLLNEDPPAASTDPLKHVGAYVYDYARSSQMAQLQISAVKGELKFVPVIVKTDGTKIDASGMVEWSVSRHAEIADFTDAGGKKSNVLKASGEGDDEVGVVCALKGDAYSQFDLDPGADVKVEFTVGVIEQAGAYVESIELLDENGDVLKASDTLKLDYEDGKPLSYQFSARLSISDPAEQESGAKHTVTTEDADLSDRDRELVESLVWSVADPEDSSIDKTGLFKATAKLETTVMCSTSKGHGGASVSASTAVNTGLDIDVQGASHPQDTLLVIAPSEVVKAPGGASAGEANADNKAGEAAEGPGGGSAPTGAAEEEGAPSSPAASPDADESADGENLTTAKPEPVNKAYSLDELSSLGWSTATFTFQGGTAGAAGESSNSTTITGAGPSLVAILEDAGVDFDKVRSITFVNYQGESETIAWSAMGGENSAAMLAASSVVHVGDEGDSVGESGLLKNTRFRLLVADGASVESALPWVNTIRVNGDGAGSGGSESTDDSLRAVIGYIPVPKGSTAVLSPGAIGLYKDEQFGCEWYESNDGGITWSGPTDSAPTKRVPTSDSTIGRMYRVVITTDAGRTAESDPVTIVEGKEFSVTLAFDPPHAGDVAFFTTSVSNVDPADITDYIWEWTEDGGNTWQEIAGSRGNPTFSAKTDPIEEKSGGESAESGDGVGSEGDGDSAGEEIDKTPAPSMWVHVRVLATGGREAVSNPVMLMVHVGEDSGTGQVPTVDIPDELPDEPSAPGADDPVVTPEEPTEDQPTDPVAAPVEEQGEVSDATPVMQEVSSITVETAPRSHSQSTVVSSETPATEQTPDGTQTAPTPESAESDSPTDLIVNPEVTAEILEQREAVNAAVQATHPGARWTALTTVDPDGKDVQRILSDNPFAPFTAPFALGITVAGFVEKLLGFRRQTR